MTAVVLVALLCALATAQPAPRVARTTRLRLILVEQGEVNPQLTLAQIEKYYHKYPHHDAVLAAGAPTDVVLNSDFLLGLISATEYPEPGVGSFRVLFLFEWEQINGTDAALRRAADKQVPPLDVSAKVSGAKYWWTADYAKAVDPRLAMRWRLQLSRHSFDFHTVAPKG